jgi:acetylornithine/succinyldiaminopimelate/putrescine aminotransferase
VLVLGKLGGGVYPCRPCSRAARSATLLKPATTAAFGGNPLAAAVGTPRCACSFASGSPTRGRGGQYLFRSCGARGAVHRRDSRPRLLVGIEIAAAAGSARSYCERLLQRACSRRTRTRKSFASRRRGSSSARARLAVEQLREVLR